MASPHNRWDVGVPRERPQFAHMAIGLVVSLFFVFSLHYILEESALVSIMIFNSLSILLTFPLKGPLWCKILWLGLGNLVGAAWNLIGLSLNNVTAELVVFEFLHFVTGSITEFLWIVPVWSFGVSALASAEREMTSGQER